jgi:hypothetical protein
MSNNPEERDKDNKEVAEDNIERSEPEPLDKQDPTEPVKVPKGSEGKAINITGSNATGL